MEPVSGLPAAVAWAYGPQKQSASTAGHSGPAAQESRVNPSPSARPIQIEECKTCSERAYVDGSDDPGVSFQNPTRVSPEAAASAVISHENEHVRRERASAEVEGREVVSQYVRIHQDICPECGRMYVAGGTTTTVTRDRVEPPETTDRTGIPRPVSVFA